MSPTREANTEELSETNVEALLKSIDENSHLSFREITEKSHDAAWVKAEENGETETSYLDIAESADATREMLEYIMLNAENNSLRAL